MHIYWLNFWIKKFYIKNLEKFILREKSLNIYKKKIFSNYILNYVLRFLSILRPTFFHVQPNAVWFGGRVRNQDECSGGLSTHELILRCDGPHARSLEPNEFFLHCVISPNHVWLCWGAQQFWPRDRIFDGTVCYKLIII
jgi:hypothetical protein